METFFRSSFKMKILHVLLMLTIISSLLGSHGVHAQSQNCSGDRNLRFAACNSLPVLDSVLHWNYHPSNNTVVLAYRQTSVTDSNWVAWCLNPTRGGMIGAQCLVAFRNTTSGIIHAYTSPISSYGTTLQEGPLSFEVPTITAEFTDNEMILYANIQLPVGRTKFTQVWQHGIVAAGNRLLPHSFTGAHMRSFSTIDFTSAVSSAAVGGEGGSRERMRYIHGAVNIVSWGVMMPLGAMIARYLKVFKAASPAWFYLHVACQTSAYIMGVAGWGTGMKLGRDSVGVTHEFHRNIGIPLFVLGTLQAFALRLRPKPDSKYRIYWNLYHWGTGYAVIILSIVNIFKGLDIFDPGKKWKRAYIGVLIFFGACIAVLEPFTWYVVLKRKRQQQPKTPPNNGGNEAAANRINGDLTVTIV